MSRPDPDILERAHAGDREVIGALLEPELGRVYATCRRMVGNHDDAAELAQDALVRAIRGIESYDGRSAFSTWLTRVTINTCLSWHRRQGRRAGKTPVAIENPDVFPDQRDSGRRLEPGGVGGVQGGSGDAVGGADRRSRVEIALERIKPEHRAVLVLRDVRELDYEAIGAALDLPLGTVKSRISRARRALRQEMESLEGPPAGTAAAPPTDQPTGMEESPPGMTDA